MDNVGKIDLKEQLKSLFDTGINLSIGQIGAIQWAINQVDISKTETTSEEDDTYSQCEECGQFYLDSRGYNYCPNCGQKIDWTED